MCAEIEIRQIEEIYIVLPEKIHSPFLWRAQFFYDFNQKPTEMIVGIQLRIDFPIRKLRPEINVKSFYCLLKSNWKYKSNVFFFIENEIKFILAYEK